MDWIRGINSGPFNQGQIDNLSSFLSELNSEQLQWLRGYLTGIGTDISNSTIDTSKNSTPSLLILYGTQTGNTENLSLEMGLKAQAAGINVTTKNMADFKGKDFKKVTNLAVIVSTQGIGEPPIASEELYELLHSKKAPSLSGIKYSVLALGDTSYAQFCQTGKDFDHILEKLGAERILPRVDCDVDYEEDAERWIDVYLKEIQAPPQIQINRNKETTLNEKDKYDRKNPFKSTLLEKINLNGRGSSKETIHLEFSLENSGIIYQPGDAVGIYAPNATQLVDAILNMHQLSGEEEVTTHNGTKKLREALTFDYELTPLTAVSLTNYTKITGSKRLQSIIDDNTKVLKYLYGRDLIDVFKEVPSKLSAEQLTNVLRKNTARLYSIASSQQVYEDEVHLLVSVVRYQAYSRIKEGLCSSFLADRLCVDEQANIFIEKNNKFRLPEDHQQPIIMIGPGTGIAPFRAFIQERSCLENTGKSWLFFGDRNFTTDFLYQTEWQEYMKDGRLTKADLAFSRDSDKKIYVQHKMTENSKELFDWLENGAHIYVCGDASKMAKDVNNTLIEIVKEQGNKTNEQAQEYIKHLQITNRYQTDVY